MMYPVDIACTYGQQKVACGCLILQSQGDLVKRLGGERRLSSPAAGLRQSRRTRHRV